MICDTDDDDFKLTKEYKHLLSNIRPLIEQLDNSKDAQLCLLWLSKLEQCGNWEWKYRNKILHELSTQVRDRYLKQPFSFPPSSGPLENIIIGDYKVPEWSNNELSDCTTELSSNSPPSESSIRTASKRQSSPSPLRERCLYSNFRMKEPALTGRNDPDHSECFAIQKKYHERVQSDQVVIEKYEDIIKSLVAQQSKSDMSPGRLKKLQSVYENKMTNLVHLLKSATNENEMLKRKLESVNHDLIAMETVMNENENLKDQVAKLTTAKNLLDIKLKECEEEKLVTCNKLMTKLNDSDEKLKKSEEHHKLIEKEFEEKYKICETQHLIEKNEMEKTYVNNLCAMERELEQKESEIEGLKEIMSNQCSHFEQEVSKLKHEFVENSTMDKDKKKIKVLKNKARKLEKMREHMAVLFHSQLQQVIAKKDFYIATLEMQLKMLTTECDSTNINSSCHDSLIQKVSSLETQYRKLLEDSERQSLMRRQIDLQKIHNLEKQLLLCGGVVEGEESTSYCLKTKFPISVTPTDEEPKVDII
ncbi:hypothetical protein RUM44_011277 [Polyplax serrata]|uniref:DUF4485 domain-containing protein n=1 Tax=Polyplax serrata TaxID=468196 RepID=A0ABR1ARB5_POLSC